MSLASVNRRVKPTGAEGERVWTASRVPGGARPGCRTGLLCHRRRTGVNTPSQSEGEHLTGGRAPTQSEDRRVTESGGTLGQSCPTKERVRRGQTPNTQDRARRRAANHRKQTEQVCELGTSFEEALWREPTIMSVQDGYLVDEHVGQTSLSQEKGGGVWWTNS